MIKNTAGQKIGGQMVTAADGTAFTGAVTVAVTVDAGTQATGTVGSGACAHEGNGYHTYAPSQAETNGDLLAYTFTGSGAIPATVQVYTVAGDAFTRLGAPAGASVSADILVIDNFVDGLEATLGAAGAGLTALATQSSVDAVKVDTAAILVDTGTTLDARLPAALVSGRMDSSVGAMASNVMTAAAAAADLTTELQSGLATAAALAVVDDFLDSEIAAIITTLGTPAGASISADLLVIDNFVDGLEATIGAAGAGLTALATQASVDAVKVDTAAILVDTGTTLDGRIPAALVSGRMDSSVGAMAANVLTATAINADAITAAKVAADVTTEIQTGLATSAALATVQADTDNIQTRLPAALVSGRIDASVGAMAANVMTAAAAASDLTTELQAGLATAAALATVQTSVDTVDNYIDTEIATISAALDAVLALLDDARTEPGQGALPVNPDMATKIDYLYKFLRNRKTNDGAETKLYADNGTTIDHKQLTSEAGGTVEKAEWITGA